MHRAGGLEGVPSSRFHQQPASKVWESRGAAFHYLWLSALSCSWYAHGSSHGQLQQKHMQPRMVINTGMTAARKQTKRIIFIPPVISPLSKLAPRPLQEIVADDLRLIDCDSNICQVQLGIVNIFSLTGVLMLIS